MLTFVDFNGAEMYLESIHVSFITEDTLIFQ